MSTPLTKDEARAAFERGAEMRLPGNTIVHRFRGGVVEWHYANENWADSDMTIDGACELAWFIASDPPPAVACEPGEPDIATLKLENERLRGEIHRAACATSKEIAFLRSELIGYRDLRELERKASWHRTRDAALTGFCASPQSMDMQGDEHRLVRATTLANDAHGPLTKEPA